MAENRCVFVGNLSWGVTNDDLYNLMSPAGEIVEANIKMGRDGRSRGCGVVEYATAADAMNAMETLNGIEHDGRAINVREDREQGAPAAKPARRQRAPKADSAARGPAEPTNKVYVGNLSWGVTDDDLYALMEPAGEIIQANIKYGNDGRSRGCGIVEYATVADATNAINTLSGQEYDGRVMLVREDREAGKAASAAKPARAQPARRQRSAPRASSLTKAYGGEPGSTVYVGNLPWSVDEAMLNAHMSAAGTVVHAEVLRAGDGRSKGCGVVRFSAPAEAAQAIATLHDSEIEGRPLVVREDREEQKFKNAGSVMISNVADGTYWQDLKDHLKPFGEVLHVDMLDGGRASVRLVDVATAQAVVDQLNGTVFAGQELEVTMDRTA
eukprot:m.38924 g.38924  ORF g.38924 m.38924 type:complete len:384 (+) comp12622_c0_seq1:40-1191(+)